MDVPIVIFHRGNQEYFQNCVKLNSIKNKVIVIGDDTNKNTFIGVENIKHINLRELFSSKINIFINNFTNYSTNDARIELLCFLRVFYIRKTMELENIDKVCHLDSDCILLEKTNKLFKTIDTPAYLLTNRHHDVNKNINNSGTIHTSLLTIDFCDKFIDLCYDIYVNKSKFYLIEPKIKYFKDNNLPGGVCDMTIYYLLFSEKSLEVFNLFNIFNLNGELSTCDDNINDSEGYYEKNAYSMNNGKKNLVFSNGKVFVEDSKKNLIRFYSLHFQGPAKNYLIDKFDDFKQLLLTQI
jgi:hypothetical protein